VTEPPRRGGPQFIPRPELWTPGRPAPWVERPSGLIAPERARIAVPPGRRGVASPVAELGASPSAVLIALYEDDGELHVVLTRRSWSLRTHRGEVSFPGGRSDPGEDPVTTAVREAHEEVDLDPRLVEPLGELDHLTTVTRRAYIVPVVALLEEPPLLRANPAEVEQVLQVPLTELLEPGVFREERWGPPGLARPVYFFDLHGDTVWGATAALLRQLLALLTGTDPGAPSDTDPARDLDRTGFQLGPDGLDGVV
jgi:8-oxo-dGTP pyrophosphatase MutT (NUDIX family)